MRLYFCRFWIYLAMCLLAIAGSSIAAESEESSSSPVLESMMNDSTPPKKEVPRVPEPSGPSLPRERLSIGLNYTGGQVRWRLSPRWAAEGRLQFGKADSNYGKVHSNVFGLRAYRFIPFKERERLVWYLGGEAAYARAESDTSSYTTSGFAMGGFGGLEYRILSRLSAGADIGPYVISLKEKQTGLTSTGLDFVINTALNFYVL